MPGGDNGSETLGDDHHFPHSVGVVLGQREGFGEVVEGTRMGDEGGEPGDAAGEEREGFMRFLAGAAHVEDGELLASHGGDFEGHEGGGVDAGEDDASAVAGGADGGVRRVLARGAIDGAIDAAVGGVGVDLAGGVEGCGVERDIGSEVEGEVAAVGDGFDGPDTSGAGGFEAGDGEQADGAGAEDGDGLTGLDGGESQGVHGDRERLDDGGQFEREFRRDGEEIGGREVDEFAEKAGMTGIAQEANIRADVVMAGAAEFAVVAVERGLERGAVSGGPAGDSGAGPDDGSCGLVAEHHGVFARGITDCAFGVGMQVATANANGIHPYLDFAGSGVFDGNIGESELAWGDKFGYKHLQPL